MKNIIHIILLFIFIGCSSEESHIDQLVKEAMGDKDAAGIFEFHTDSDIPINDIHIYGFSALGDLEIYKYYSTAKVMANGIIGLDAANYKFVVAVNVGRDFNQQFNRTKSDNLPDITLLELSKKLIEVSSDDKNILTGSLDVDIKSNIFNRVSINISNSTGSLKLKTLRLSFSLPEDKLPPLTIVPGPGDIGIKNYRLRATVEVFQNDTRQFGYTTTDLAGHTFDLEDRFTVGNYTILMWTDYIPVLIDDSRSHRTDHFYNTTDLQEVTYSKIPYAANNDGRDVGSLNFDVTVGEDNVTKKAVTLERALAKYNIVSNDVQEYMKLSKDESAKYPNLEQLTIEVSYPGNIPNTFNVKDNKIIDSGAGVKYDTQLYYTANETTVLASDYIFIDTPASLIKATIIIKGPAPDYKVISKIEDIDIKLERNLLATITGNFLTAGISSAGITIDTSWGEDINHPFTR